MKMTREVEPLKKWHVRFGSLAVGEKFTLKGKRYEKVTPGYARAFGSEDLEQIEQMEAVRPDR